MLFRSKRRLLGKLLSHCGKNVVGISGSRDITSYEVLRIQAFLVLECLCDFCTDGRFTDSRSACNPAAVLGVRMGACPQPNLVQHSFPRLSMVLSLFLIFRVVLGLWDDAVTQCLLNELQSPGDLTLRTDIRLE